MGFGAVIPLGQYAAVALVGVVLMFPRLWSAVKTYGWRWAVVLAWAVLALLLLEVVVISQARGVWLALGTVTVMLAGLVWPPLVRRNLRKGLATLTVTVLAVVLVVYANQGLITARLAQESDVLGKLISGDIDQITTTQEREGGQAVAVRVEMLAFALEHWKEKPMLGFGPGATEPLLQGSDNMALSVHPDVHNIYLEILLRLGLVGGGLAVACLGLVLWSGWRGHREGRMDQDVFLLLGSAFAIYLIAGLTNVRLLDQDGWFFWWFFGGAMASYAIYPRSPSA